MKSELTGYTLPTPRNEAASARSSDPLDQYLDRLLTAVGQTQILPRLKVLVELLNRLYDDGLGVAYDNNLRRSLSGFLSSSQATKVDQDLWQDFQILDRRQQAELLRWLKIRVRNLEQIAPAA